MIRWRILLNDFYKYYDEIIYDNLIILTNIPLVDLTEPPSFHSTPRGGLIGETIIFSGNEHNHYKKVILVSLFPYFFESIFLKLEILKQRKKKFMLLHTPLLWK